MTRISGFALLAASVTAAGCSTPNPHIQPTQLETALVQYATCDALESDLKSMLVSEVQAHFDQLRYWQSHGGGIYNDGPGLATPTAGGTSSSTRTQGVDFSGTNNQEAGVDESDFVKTDGYNIYVINGNRLHIFGVPQFGQLVPSSVTELEGNPTEMLVNRDAGRTVVFAQIDPSTLPVGHPLRDKESVTTANGAVVWRVNQVSKISVFDTSDVTAPKLIREIFVEGWYQTARMVGTSVRIGAYSYLNIPGIDYWYPDGSPTLDEQEIIAIAGVKSLALTDIIPMIYERLPDGTFNSYSQNGNECQSFFRPEDSQARGVTSLLTIDLSQPGFAYDAQQIVSNWATIYASTTDLYVVENAHDWWWFWWNWDEQDQTNIHQFDISQPDKAVYVGSGRVDGQINDTFSLGAYNGNLRVATTTNWETRWWVPVDEQPVVDNHVFVLAPKDGRLAKIGRLDGIATGERIFSSRFMADQGYVVTYKQVDPLFTLDLSDPTNPRVEGSVETPGVSNYLQQIDNGRLLSIGYGGTDTELDWSQTEVSLFNVSDFAHPALQAQQDLTEDGTWSWSEAQYEHKAFQYWAPEKLLAVPVSSFNEWYDANGWHYTYMSHLKLVTVDPATGLSLYGDINHSAFYNSNPDEYWVNTDIQRSIFMGDYIYALSDRGISVHRTADLQMVASQPLPGWLPNTYWWWY